MNDLSIFVNAFTIMYLMNQLPKERQCYIPSKACSDKHSFEVGAKPSGSSGVWTCNLSIANQHFNHQAISTPLHEPTLEKNISSHCFNFLSRVIHTYKERWKIGLPFSSKCKGASSCSSHCISSYILHSKGCMLSSY